GRRAPPTAGRRADRRARHRDRRRHPAAAARALRRGRGRAAGDPRAPLRGLGRPRGVPARRTGGRRDRHTPGERPMSAFRAALRLSWRETRHAKGRTALVMTMIGLPVLVITALLTYYATVDVTLAEDPAAVLGAADARIVTTAYTSEVSQSLAATSNWRPRTPPQPGSGPRTM